MYYFRQVSLSFFKILEGKATGRSLILHRVNCISKREQIHEFIIVGVVRETSFQSGKYACTLISSLNASENRPIKLKGSYIKMSRHKKMAIHLRTVTPRGGIRISVRSTDIQNFNCELRNRSSFSL